MTPYQAAWLRGHPDRTEAWLRDRLAEGFDVHHLDSDHSNNDPANLVLIEHLDHMRIHRAPGNRLEAKRFGSKGALGPTPKTLEMGRAAYDAVKAGSHWVDLPVHSYERAKKYALHAGAVWPIVRAKPPKLGRKPKPPRTPQRVWTSAEGWILRV